MHEKSINESLISCVNCPTGKDLIKNPEKYSDCDLDEVKKNLWKDAIRYRKFEIFKLKRKKLKVKITARRITLKVKTKRDYFMSNEVLTVLVRTEMNNGKEIIFWTPPIVRKFVGQPFENLEKWMKNKPGFKKQQLFKDTK